MSFDYGNTKTDGQYERYPTNQVGEFKAPVRNAYIHETCGRKTFCGSSIAETYAKHPTYYGRTFCSACHAHYPVTQFKWAVDGVQLGLIGDEGKAGLDMTEEFPKYIS